MKIGYHISHEQFSPRELLELACLAERSGFQACLSSDHFQPWMNSQGNSGYAWSWLGAALAATEIPFGIVTAPGQRYHPAIVAQAGATLAEMFPGRFWMAVGSGQMLNESITGDKWPDKEQRNLRLRECADIMRRLWTGETVTHRGLVNVESARLYSLPDRPPMIIGAALTPATAHWLGSWADGLITVSKPKEQLRQVIEAFHDGGGEGKPTFLKVQLSYARSRQDAVSGAFDQWRANIFESPVQTRLAGPDEFDAAAAFITPDDLSPHVRISPDLHEHIDWIASDGEMGFEQIYLHNVNRLQRQFIEDFGEKVLPAVAKSYSGSSV
jgi:probable non-F420 flavinoid oxidoreductase